MKTDIDLAIELAVELRQPEGKYYRHSVSDCGERILKFARAYAARQKNRGETTSVGRGMAIAAAEAEAVQRRNEEVGLRMNERPILFSAPMVRALLDGTKTQTRRMVKFIPTLGEPFAWCATAKAQEPGWGHVVGDYRRFCPYGQPGDQLWVREEHACLGHGSTGPSITVRYSIDGEVRTVDVTAREYQLFRARKSKLGADVRGFFMYRSLSCIQLEVTGVSVERLNDISEEDAKAEGVEKSGPFFGAPTWKYYTKGDEDVAAISARESYRSLWESISGPGSWAANPWVWVIEFRRITT